MSNDVFKRRMKELRQKKGLSMEQLAVTLGVTKSRVNMWENSGSVPKSELLIRIAEFYDVPTDYLLGNPNSSDSDTINTLQRNLKKMNPEELKQAEKLLKEAFSNIFNDEEDEDDGF